jgi:hypothetical protein
MEGVPLALLEARRLRAKRTEPGSPSEPVAPSVESAPAHAVAPAAAGAAGSVAQIEEHIEESEPTDQLGLF